MKAEVQICCCDVWLVCVFFAGGEWMKQNKTSGNSGRTVRGFLCCERKREDGTLKFFPFLFDLGLRRQMEQAMEQAYEQALAFQRACVFALAAALGPVVLCWLAWI